MNLEIVLDEDFGPNVTLLLMLLTPVVELLRLCRMDNDLRTLVVGVAEKLRVMMMVELGAGLGHTDTLSRLSLITSSGLILVTCNISQSETSISLFQPITAQY